MNTEIETKDVATDDPGKTVTIIIKKELNVTKFAKEAFLNLPECSLSLRCTSFNYDDMTFTFLDHNEDENKEHILTRKKIEVGVEKFINRCLNGEDENLSNPNFLFELGNWDAEIIDMAIQTCIFDEVIYG